MLILISNKDDIVKCHLYVDLTHTDGCSWLFNFICKKECNIRKSESRNLIFQILKQSKIVERLDVSEPFWSQLEMRNENVKKQMGLYEIENISNANICMIAVNPKEYFEKFKNGTLNKKHRGMRRDTVGMNFESYAKRIATLRQPDDERNEKQIVQKSLQVTNTEMKMTSVNKVQFAGLNDKRYYFSYGIVSLPYGHPRMSKICQMKKSYLKIHNVI